MLISLNLTHPNEKQITRSEFDRLCERRSSEGNPVQRACLDGVLVGGFDGPTFWRFDGAGSCSCGAPPDADFEFKPTDGLLGDW